MTNQEIKDRAPDGATHYDEDCDYLRLDSGKWSFWNSFHEIWRPMPTPTEGVIIMFNIKPL